MNYRHAYHAGSFTDVIKHIILTGLFTALSQKNSPLCYVDTHAGIGYYDLFAEFAEKNKEYKSGIEKIIQADNPKPLIKKYLDCVHRINNQLTHSSFAALRYYPGSPMIARFLARPHDRLINCELQQQEYQTLRKVFAGDKQVAIHHLDGFIALKAFLPPPERRGLILIDPPYENPDEFTRIARSLSSTIKRFETGVYAIWYPIKEKNQIKPFYQLLKQHFTQSILVIEFSIYPDLPQHLNGCGMIIINPPWQFQATMDDVLPWLWKALTINAQGAYSTYFLK